MVALRTGREVTNQVENKKGAFINTLVGLESMQFHKGGICLHRKGVKKKQKKKQEYFVLLKPEIYKKIYLKKNFYLFIFF